MAVNSAWGIDVGNRALKAIKLVRDGDGVRVDDFEVIEHETVLSNAGDNREALIQASLTALVQRHSFKRETVGIGVSGQSSFARFIKLPPVETKKIPEIVRFEAIQQIPFPLDDVEWSYQLFTSEESPDVEVGIFAMRKELINQHIGYFTDAELNVQVVQMNPLAVYNAMFYDGRIKGTTMIIDMGAENTDLIIADEHTIWLRSIPIGGNNFTETLVKSFKLNFTKAEELKRNAASSKYARQIFQAMRPVFADLVAEVQRSIGFYASVHRDSRIKKIIALGGTFKLPGLQKYLQQNLQLDVERLDNLGAGAPPDPKTAGAFNDNLLSMVSAYGLALQTLGEGKLTSSLLPARIRREKLWQDKAKWFAAAAALFVLGTGVGFGAWFVHNVNYDSAQAERERIATVQGQTTTLDSDWQAIETAGAADRQRITNIRSLTEYRDLWPSLLADINAAIPQAPPDIHKKVPARNQREQVTLESIASRYAPDLAPVLADPDFRKYADNTNLPAVVMPQQQQPAFGGQGGFGSPEFMDPALMEDPSMGMGGYDMSGGIAPVIPGATPGAAGAQRGFLITVRGTTPYADATTFINKTMVAALEAINQAGYGPNRPYYVSKAELVIANPLREDTQRLQQMKLNYDQAMRARGVQPGVQFQPMEEMGMEEGFQGFQGVQPGQPGQLTPAQQAAALAAEERKPFLDPVTGEDMRDDLQFTVLFVALLDPPPAPTETTPTGTTTEGEAPPEGQPADAQPAPADGQAAPAEGQPAPAEGQPQPAEDQPAPAATPAPADGQPAAAQQPPTTEQPPAEQPAPTPAPQETPGAAQ